jgi:hypothetical protein
VVPAVIVVDVNTLLDVNRVNEHVALGLVLEVSQAFNVINLVVEASSEN